MLQAIANTPTNYFLWIDMSISKCMVIPPNIMNGLTKIIFFCWVAIAFWTNSWILIYLVQTFFRNLYKTKKVGLNIRQGHYKDRWAILDITYHNLIETIFSNELQVIFKIFNVLTKSVIWPIRNEDIEHI